MRRLTAYPLLFFTGIMQFIVSRAWAGGGGLEVPEALEQDVSLDGLSGIQLFFAQMYNDNLLLFAIVCTVLMAALGIFIAFITDIGLKAMGLEINKISHEE